MPKSRVNEKKTYNENTWVVSVLTTNGKLPGHSILVVEGIKIIPTNTFATLFMGQYDIAAEEDEQQSNKLNYLGHITEVKVREPQDPQEVSRFENYAKKYKNYRSRSWNIHPQDAENMIRSIKEDAAICKQAANGDGEYPRYQLFGSNHPLSDLNMGDNCTSWCMAKLKVGGIDLDVLSKPIKLTSTSSCVMS